MSEKEKYSSSPTPTPLALAVDKSPDNDYSLKIRCGVSIDFNLPANSPLLTGSDQVWKMRAEQYTVK